jgi:K+-transporting ATPase ATPase A chain
MNTWGWLQLAFYVVVLLLLAKPLGAYMAAVYEGRAVRAQRIGGWLERLMYRGAGVDPAREMSWIDYALAMLWFNLLGGLAVYALQRLQVFLPLNPQAMAAVSPDSAFNTATSFISNTNWQWWAAEHDELSHADAGLGVQNFVSAATGGQCWSRWTAGSPASRPATSVLLVHLGAPVYSCFRFR